MLKFLALVSVHRWTIALINLGIVAIASSAIYDLAVTHARPHHEAEDIIEGMGVILISWGVALEERHKLREVFGLVSQGEGGEHLHDEFEEVIDENCHRYGLGLLLLGLFAEVGAECVKIPDRVINTDGIESEVLLFSSLMLVAGVLLMIRQIFYLFTTSRKNGRPL